MMRRRLAGRRAGFTLLEMILALAIGLVLLSGVYVSLTMQLNQAQSGREVTQEATTARSILTRMTADILGGLGPYDPKQIPAPNTSTITGTEAAPAGMYVQFNNGVIGDSSTLRLAIGRVPREVLGTSSPKTGVSDLRRAIYWVAEGQGLMYQEITGATSADIDATDPDVDMAKKFAPEVRAITFQYWDGGSWSSSWDSTAFGPDGETPIGSPAAIEITLEMTPRDENQTPKKYRHVVQIPAGNNYSIVSQ